MYTMLSSTRAVVEIIRSIPRGKVSCYRDIALAAGLPKGARQVVRVLHSLSEKENLPWHRVVRAGGCIALRPCGGLAVCRASRMNPKKSPARAIFYPANCVSTPDNRDFLRHQAQKIHKCNRLLELQAALLRAEGVEVSQDGRVDMEKYGILS